jgi:hypothetical protein
MTGEEDLQAVIDELQRELRVVEAERDEALRQVEALERAIRQVGRAEESVRNR